jgi:hypothetical protein
MRSGVYNGIPAFQWRHGAAFIAGWTLIEYWIHRSLFHHVMRREHWLHHKRPRGFVSAPWY